LRTLWRKRLIHGVMHTAVSTWYIHSCTSFRQSVSMAVHSNITKFETSIYNFLSNLCLV